MPNNPATRMAGATQVAAGNKIVRGSKLTVAVAKVASSPVVEALPSSTPEVSPIPAGIIVMWSGLLSAIPAGWALCDGSAGTPDLRSRFVKGAAAGIDPGATGGAALHTPAGTLDAHTTTIALVGGVGTTLVTGPGTHTFTGTAADYQPQFYALAFIVKLPS